MQALRGSVFGIGTDIGGSVSMPASFNGIFSLKPSTGRISMKGVASPGPGQQIMPATAGIMGPSIATVRLVLKSLLSAEPWLHDPYVVPLPWREAEEYHPDEQDEQNRPTFGFMEDDAVVTPHPPVQRALRTVKCALGKLGYNVRAIGCTPAGMWLECLLTSTPLGSRWSAGNRHPTGRVKKSTGR